MKRVIPLFLILVFGTLFAVLLLNPAPKNQQTLQQLPALQLIQQNGQPLMLPIAGQGFVVNVFASWCVPCAAEMPLLTELAKTTPIYSIAYKDEPKALAAYLQRYGNPFTAIINDDGTATAQLGITGVPESYLVDKTGRIVRHAAGMLDAAELADWQTELKSWQ